MANEIKDKASSNKLAKAQSSQDLERAVVAPDGSVQVRHPQSAIQSVDIADVDLLLTFSNGKFVVIPNGALDAISGNSPTVVFGDGKASLAALFKSVGVTAPAKPGSLRLVTENIDAQKPPSSPESGPRDVVEVDVPAPPAPMVKVSPGATPSNFSTAMTAGSSKGNGTGNGTGEGPGEVPAIITNLAPVQPTVFPQGKRTVKTEDFTQTKSAEEILAQLGLGALPTFDNVLYTSSKFKVTPSGRTDLPLGAYDASANSDQLAERASPLNQSRRELINGTSGNDTIDHNPAFSDAGQWTKDLHLTFNNFSIIQTIEIVATNNILGIPGFNIEGAGVTKVGARTWEVAPNDQMYAEGLDLHLVYTVADTGAPIDFSMDITVTGKTGPLTFPVTNNLIFTWRDAVTQDDFTVFSSTGEPLMVLPRGGVGVEIRAGDGDDTVKAGAGNDLLMGQAGNDTLEGGLGDDTLDGGLGVDVLKGNEGSDTATYANSSLGVTATLTTTLGIANTNEAAGDTYFSIENLTGSEKSDTLIGDAQANILTGGQGNDVLEGMIGSDTLDGGIGTDTASYEHAGSWVKVSLTDNADNGGNDANGDILIRIENLTGGDHDDILIGNSEGNVLRGGKGDDTLYSMGGADVLYGGDGVDTASFSTSGASIRATLTTGLVDFSQAGDASGVIYDHIENLTGTAYDDWMIGDGGVNTLTGGRGNNILEGMGGADSLVGNIDVDTVSYEHADASVVSSLTTVFTDGPAVVQMGDAEGDTYTSIENMIGSEYADTLIGDGRDNVIRGGLGGDVLEGMGGADTLIGSVGGIDTASYIHATSFVRASLTAGLSGFVAEGHAGGDTYQKIENLTGSGYDDSLIGDANANTINGGAGNDILEGMIGADALIGGGGNDTASYAHAASDTNGAGVTANLANAAANTGDAATGDTYTNIANLLGSDFNDTLIGNGSNNVLTGGKGNDALVGAAGTDTLYGGDGNDLLTDDGVGLAILDGGAGDDTITLTGNDGSYDTLTGGAGVDTLVWSGAGSRVDVNLELGGNLGYIAATIASRATGNGFENVTATANNQIYVYMSNADNVITGGSTTSDWVDYRYATGGIVADLSQSGVNVTGGSGNDTLVGIDHLYYGSDYNDRLIGNGGGNILQGGRGADYMDGGDGFDYAYYNYWDNGGAANVSLLDAATNSAVGFVFSNWAAGDTLKNIEGLLGSNYGEILWGNGVANIIYGQGGDDVLQGFKGADVLDGGGGTNTVSFSHAGLAVVGDATTGVNEGVTATLTNGLSGISNTGDAAGDTYVNIQNLTGSDFNDTLVGSSANNVIDGAAGDDVLEGLGGADTFRGGAGIDTVTYAHSGAAVIADLNGAYVGLNDSVGDIFVGIENLTGSAHNDTLYGDSGKNVLIGGAGDDVLNGGAGFDTVRYDDAKAGVTIDLAAGTVVGSLGANVGNDSLASIEQVIGSAYVDTIIGGNDDDVIDGGGAADILNGGGGINTLSYASATGPKTVTLNGANTEGDTLSNFQNLIGSAYGDSLTGDSGDNVIVGGLGNDTLDGAANNVVGDTASYAGAVGAVNVSINSGVLGLNAFSASMASPIINTLAAGKSTGTAGVDTLSNFENLLGSAFNDILAGDDGANTLDGGDGNDLLVGGGGADVLKGGSGTDTASYETAGVGVAVAINGSGTAGDALGDVLSGIENLIGSSQDDTLTGDIFANVIDGGAGNDVLNGGGGADTVSYASAAAGVSVDLSSGGINATGGGGNDQLLNFVNITGSRYADSLTGDGGANVFDGGLGADTFNGGLGPDTATYVNSQQAVVVSLLSGATNSGGDAAGDVFVRSGSYSSVENLTGSTFGDSLTGDASANVLDGGAGDDLLLGGAGGDTLIGGLGTDTVSYAGSTSVTVNLTSANYRGVNQGATYSGYGGAGDASGDTYSGVENVTGSSNNDALMGSSGNNVIDGGAGNDLMWGDAGNDVLKANLGNDTAYGEAGDDVIYVSASASNMPTLVDGGADSSLSSGGGDVMILQNLASGTYSLNSLASKTNYMEILDIRNDGANTSLQLSSLDVRNFVDGGNASRLMIRADAGDALSIQFAGGETSQSFAVAGGTDYIIFSGATQVAQIHWQTA